MGYLCGCGCGWCGCGGGGGAMLCAWTGLFLICKPAVDMRAEQIIFAVSDASSGVYHYHCGTSKYTFARLHSVRRYCPKRSASKYSNTTPYQVYMHNLEWRWGGLLANGLEAGKGVWMMCGSSLVYTNAKRVRSGSFNKQKRWTLFVSLQLAGEAARVVCRYAFSNYVR